MHALVTYLVKGSAYVLANEFVAFITFYVRKINVCLTILLFIPILTPDYIRMRHALALVCTKG